MSGTATTKTCSSCKLEKPEAEFHRFGKDGGRIGKWCKDCYARNKKKSRKAPAAASLTTA